MKPIFILICFSDSSSDEESNSKPTPPKKRKSFSQNYYEEKTHSAFPSRGTVIVSPPNNVAAPTSSGFPYNATSSSQDSETSDNESVDEPSIHKAYIKPKPTSSPVMDVKAKAMMVSILLPNI